MVHAVVKMELNPGKYADAMRVLHSVAARVRTLPGCLGCVVYQDTEKRHVIMFEEFWRDKDRLQQHLRSDEYQSVLLVMDMAQSQPVISFNVIAESTGIETVELARQGLQS